MATEDDLSVYRLTITPDHRLEVNDTPVANDAIPPGDSESLLAWGMEQVSRQHDEQDTYLHLTIDDRRANGYGSTGVRIAPGARVSIYDLRKKTGKDLSYISEQAVQRGEPTTPEPEPAPPVFEDRAVEEAPAVAEAPSEDEGLPAPNPSTSGAALYGGYASGAETGDEPTVAPAPEVAATSPVDDLPDLPAADPEDDSESWLLPDPPRSVQETYDEDHDGLDEPEVMLPAGRAAAIPEPAPKTNEVEDISTPTTSYNRRLPTLGEGEAVDTSEASSLRLRKRLRLLTVALIVVLVAFGALGIRIFMDARENTYVATCIDERTMERQASDDLCDGEGAPSYYRWWYTPNGSVVPAVGQVVDPTQGTRVEPVSSQVTKGYGEDGGVVGGGEAPTTGDGASDGGN